MTLGEPRLPQNKESKARARIRKNSSQMVVKVQTEVVKDYCFSSLFYMLSNKKSLSIAKVGDTLLPYILVCILQKKASNIPG